MGKDKYLCWSRLGTRLPPCLSLLRCPRKLAVNRLHETQEYWPGLGSHRGPDDELPSGGDHGGLGMRVPPSLGLLRCLPQPCSCSACGPEKLLPGLHFQLLKMCKWSHKHLRKCCQARKKQHIVDEASFFVVEILSTSLFSVPPQPPGEAWELVWGKIKT